MVGLGHGRERMKMAGQSGERVGVCVQNSKVTKSLVSSTQHSVDNPTKAPLKLHSCHVQSANEPQPLSART